MATGISAEQRWSCQQPSRTLCGGKGGDSRSQGQVCPCEVPGALTPSGDSSASFMMGFGRQAAAKNREL